MRWIEYLWIFIGVSVSLSLAYMLIVWFRRKRHTKERFALAALGSITTLSLALVAAVAGPSMPWRILAGVLGADVPHHALRLEDYVLLIFVYITAMWAVVVTFKSARWDGLRSKQQHAIEQRRQRMQLLEAAMREASWILRRIPPTIHHREGYESDIRINPPSDSLAWRDRARELVSLKSSYYTFPQDHGWHGNARCWVGRNLNTEGAVLLNCVPDTITDNEYRSLLDYASRFGFASDGSETEIIIAAENESAIRPLAFDGPRMRFETEDTLFEELIDWTDYRSDIRKRYAAEDLPDSGLTVSDVFVRPQVVLARPRDQETYRLEERTDLWEHLDSWLHERGQRQLALLGDYGQGKSTAALAYAHRQFQQGSPPRVPVLIELRGMSPRNLSPLQLLGAWSAKYSINPKSLMRMHISGRLLLVFEGFDEMALVGDADMRLSHFKTLWEFGYPRAKILITGRPNFFLDEEEKVRSLGIAESSSGRPYCEALRLTSFDLEQVRDALRSHDKVLRDEICDLCAKDGQFRELVGRPSLLHAVALLWHDEKLSRNIGSLNSALVMRLFVRRSYRRQGLKEAEAPAFMALTTEERHYFMRGVAAYMAIKKLPNQIGGRELNELVGFLVKSMPEAVSRRSSAMSGEVTEPLRRRVEGGDHGLEFVRVDVRACGILTDDPVAPGAFRFGHKAFMEYLFAEVVAERIMDDESEDASSIMYACGAGANDILSSELSVAFLGELLQDRHSDARGTLGGQGDVAKRIFRLVVGGEAHWYYFVGRYELYMKSVIGSARSWPLFFRLLMRPIADPFLGGHVVLGSLFFVAPSMGLVEWNEIVGEVGFWCSITALLGFWVVSIFQIYLYGGGSSNTMESIATWYDLCVRLDIDEGVLGRIAGVRWLWSARGRTLGCLLGAWIDG